jgi:hypothetical protein
MTSPFTRLSLSLSALLPLLAAPLAARAENVGTVTICDFVSPTYEAVWHPGTVGETLAVQIHRDTFLAKDKVLRPAGWHVKEIRAMPYICNGNLDHIDYDVLWRKEAFDDQWVVGWSWTDFNNHNTSLRASGYRLTFANSYMLNGQVFLAGVWRKSSSAQVDDLGWSVTDFRTRLHDMTAAGWEAVYIDSYSNDNGATFYNVSWRPKTSGFQYVEGWTPAGFDQQYNVFRSQGWNLYVLSTQGEGAGLFYDGIFLPFNKSEVRTKGMSPASFQQAQAAHAAAGWNVETFIRHF